MTAIRPRTTKRPGPARRATSLPRPVTAPPQSALTQLVQFASAEEAKAKGALNSALGSLAMGLVNKIGASGLPLYDKLNSSPLGRVAFKVLGTTVGAALDFKAQDLDATVAPPPAGLATDPVGPPLAAPLHPLPWLSTRGNQIVDSTGQPVRLRGVDMSGFEYDKTGDQQSAQTFDRLAKMGVTLVRMPINQDWALSDPAYRHRLDRAIQEANARGIYVALDLHWHDNKQLPCLNPGSLKMWRQLANRYANQPGVLYDIQNEPQWITWKSYAPWAEAAIANIRAVNPKSLCIVEGTQYAANLSGVLQDPIQASNVVYSVHEYGPSLGVAVAGPALWNQLFGKVADRYPVYVGEFGGNAQDVPYGKALLAYMDKKGLSWTSWNWGASVPNLERNGKLTAFGQLVAGGLKNGVSSGSADRAGRAGRRPGG